MTVPSTQAIDPSTGRPRCHRRAGASWCDYVRPLPRIAFRALRLCACGRGACRSVRLHVETDERVAGFIALGSGIAGKLAAVVTTSGSAVANLHLAVEEANHAGVPLHRPRGRSAPRAARRALADCRPPGDPRGLRPLRGRYRRRCPRSRTGRAGQLRGRQPRRPCPHQRRFREPLMPTSTWDAARDWGPRPRAGGTGWTAIVAGPSIRSNPLYGEELPDLSGVPILAEPTSELRGHPNAVAAHPLLLRTGL